MPEKIARCSISFGAKNVLSKDRLKELSVRSNAPAFVHLATHVAAIGLNSYAMAWTWGTWWCVPFFMLQGVLLNFLYAAEHECDHFTAFRSRWLNILVARVTGFVIVLTNDYHRLSHYAHHRQTIISSISVKPEFSLFIPVPCFCCDPSS